MHPRTRLGSPLLLLLLLPACADWSVRPTFPAEAAGQPLLQEQALLGLSDEGDAAVAQLLAAEGAPPRLGLLLFDRAGGPTRTLLEADPAIAREVAARLSQHAREPLPLLAPAVAALWPEALERARELGLSWQARAAPEPGRQRFQLDGVTGLSLLLRLELQQAPIPAQVLRVGEGPGGEAGVGAEVEACAVPLVGAPVAPELWLRGATGWLLAGAVLAEAPLHRTVAVRRCALRRSEAELHNLHGLARYGAAELEAAAREFDRALAADDRFVDALYNAASVAALTDRTPEAVDLLRRAAALDLRRVQVLGRDDDDLRALRRRPDVRALLGLHRETPEPPGGR